ncbi:hypothetical protein [Catenovulum adriaticum]|uniref:HEAT repeat protein n=1 Tax=Catenovulum adriaticum TaxID=2984846 RepID=A0ABY7AIZ5_9ALTE|nr:hypothetical protein [Catenovulum sp. TS8]WAJ69203.1 hypothetical protein OLW01_08385 [Catenovulum sp. TS8]
MGKIFLGIIALISSFFIGTWYENQRFHWSQENTRINKLPANQTQIVVSNTQNHHKKTAQKTECEYSQIENKTLKQLNNEEIQLENLAINNINSLKVYLSFMDSPAFKFGKIADFVNQSEQGLSYLYSLYQNSREPASLSILGSIIQLTPSKDKINLAKDLLFDTNVEKRQFAYDIYKESDTSLPELTDSLIDASYYEDNNNALTVLIDAISKTCSQLLSQYRCANRLAELSQNKIESIAIKAISAISQLEQSQIKTDVLKHHLTNGTTEFKLAILETMNATLKKDEELIKLISQISEDHSASTQLKLAANAFLYKVELNNLDF